MKNTRILLILSIAMTLQITGCQDDEVPIGDPFSKVEGLTANDWVFESAAIIDETNPSAPQKDITDFYTQGDLLNLRFGADGSFTSIPGSGKNVFPANGTWAFYPNNETPTQIRVTSNGAVTNMLLAGPTRISDAQLKIRFVTKECTVDGVTKPAVGYRFVFNRAN
jgi:hypothetical protein